MMIVNLVGNERRILYAHLMGCRIDNYVDDGEDLDVPSWMEFGEPRYSWEDH